MAAVGPGPPDSAPVLVTTTLWPRSRTTEFGVVGGRRKALSPSRMTVSVGVAAIASGLITSSSGATAGCVGSSSAAMTSALRATAWS